MTNINKDFDNVWKSIRKSIIRFNEMEKVFNLFKTYKDFFKKAGYYNPDNGDKIIMIYNDGNLDVKINTFPKKTIDYVDIDFSIRKEEHND